MSGLASAAPLWAAAFAGLAAALLAPPAGHPVRRLEARSRGVRAGDVDERAGFGRRAGPTARAGPSRLVGTGGVTGSVAVVAVVVAVAGIGGLVTVTAVSMMAGVAVMLRSRRRSDRAAAACRVRVIEACAVLSAELRAGRPPQDALVAASEMCAELGPAAEIARLGGDVGTALAESSLTPGAGGLAALGAAWQVVERSGVALSSVASRLAESLRADEAARRQATAALAGARSTARLLAGLPLLGTVLGHLLGAEPLAFLTGTPPGWLCLLAGVALIIAGLTWTERLIAEPGPGRLRRHRVGRARAVGGLR